MMTKDAVSFRNHRTNVHINSWRHTAVYTGPAHSQDKLGPSTERVSGLQLPPLTKDIICMKTADERKISFPMESYWIM